jgi:hypothetical protein
MGLRDFAPHATQALRRKRGASERHGRSFWTGQHFQPGMELLHSALAGTSGRGGRQRGQPGMAVKKAGQRLPGRQARRKLVITIAQTPLGRRA